MIGGRRSLQGRKPGDRRVRVERPHSPYFRYTGKGQLTAKEAASAPTSATGRAFASLRALFFGRPLASEDEIGERLSKTKALAIFSSDAISSSAYATEEILRVLILGGVVALAYGVQVSVAISILLVAVAISYRQICIAYPIGRRLVHRFAAKHRPDGQPHRGLCPAHRLRDDRGGVDVVGGRADRVRVSDPVRRARPDRRYRHRAHRHRQPTRPARGRDDLRGPDLPVHRLGADHDRRRGVPDRRPR